MADVPLLHIPEFLQTHYDIDDTPIHYLQGKAEVFKKHNWLTVDLIEEIEANYPSLD